MDLHPNHDLEIAGRAFDEFCGRRTWFHRVASHRFKSAPLPYHNPLTLEAKPPGGGSDWPRLDPSQYTICPGSLKSRGMAASRKERAARRTSSTGK